MKPRILLHGEQILLNQMFLEMLKKIALVIPMKSVENIQEIFSKQSIDLLVFESMETWEQDLKLLQVLKRNYPNLIIILIDGGESPENVIRCFKMGIDDYFKKPVDTVLLTERIEALLKSKI